MKRYLCISVCIMLTVILCQAALAQVHPKSLASIQAAAEAGDSESQFQLGYKYATGDGVEKDPQVAVRWYMAAAERGHQVAAHNLGCCYATGLGVAENPQEAFKWFKTAANKGYVNSMIAVGLCYCTGAGVKVDRKESEKWFMRAEEMGSPETQLALSEAQYSLSNIYNSGAGGVKNPVKSFKWCKKSAENGYLPAQSELGIKYDNGDGVEKDPSSAITWFKKAASSGDPIAEGLLGDKYLNGTVGLAKDCSMAMKSYKLAAEQGNSAAQARVGFLYTMGIGVLKDYIEALAWMNIAASGNYNTKASIDLRDKLEKALGPQGALVAQKRSRELLASFPANNLHTNKETIKAAPFEVLNCSGSGVMISTNGLILTAAHVVSNASHIEVITSQGRQTAKILQIDVSNDIAVIKCDGTFDPIPIASSKGVKLGQSIFSIGFPNIEIQGTSPKMTKGEISSLNGYQDDPRLWQISVPIQPGNSGGPLCDEGGNVIGIVISKLNAVVMAKATGDVAQNVGYAIKSAYITPLLDSLGVNFLQSPRQVENTKFLDQVDKVSKSVVMILAYSKK
jgi:TPR repeat protein